MRDLSQLNGHAVDAHGHCRIDYTDPITGKVLERIEGDNHVFVNQFSTSLFQNQMPNATMLLTSGDIGLDTSLPYIPGIPCGYGDINSTATGIYRGAYRSTDSFLNRVSLNHVSNMYVYDFLSTQIPRKINYVGLTGQHGSGASYAPFMYKWTRANWCGMFDIKENVLYYGADVSLSSDVGGTGTIRIKMRHNVPDGTEKVIDLFDLCDRPDNSQYQNIDQPNPDKSYNRTSKGYYAIWGYDPDNKHLCLKLTRYSAIYRTEYYNNSTHYFYVWGYRDDIWVFDEEGTQVINHYTHAWQTDNEVTGSSWQWYYGFWSGHGYMLLKNETLIGISNMSQTYSYGGREDGNLYIHKYDIALGDKSCDQTELLSSEYLTLYGDRAYYYGQYFWGQGQYSSYQWTQPTFMRMGPMYDSENDQIYSYNAGGANYRSAYGLIEVGQTNIFKKLWNYRDPSSSENYTGQPLVPFAYTAYKLPSDAPERPENSAVTIAYGLTINW